MAESNEPGRYRLPGRPSRPREEEPTSFAPIPPPPLRQAEQPWMRQPQTNGASPYTDFRTVGRQNTSVIGNNPTIAKTMQDPRVAKFLQDRRKVALAAGVALLVLVLTVYALTSSFTSSGPKSYDDLEGLHKAVVSAGQACANWDPIDDEAGQCLANDQNELDLSWYSNKQDIASSIADGDATGVGLYWVVGPNWTICTKDLNDAIQLQKSLHGKAVNFN